MHARTLRNIVITSYVFLCVCVCASVRPAIVFAKYVSYTHKHTHTQSEFFFRSNSVIICAYTIVCELGVWNDARPAPAFSGTRDACRFITLVRRISTSTPYLPPSLFSSLRMYAYIFHTNKGFPSFGIRWAVQSTPQYRAKSLNNSPRSNRWAIMPSAISCNSK